MEAGLPARLQASLSAPLIPTTPKRRFLKDVHWGACDFLIIDSPPGTSDEHISIVQVCAAGGPGVGLAGWGGAAS